jgi:hypothetical protein
MTDNALAERRIDRDLADTIAIGKGGINFDNAGQVMEYAKLMAASGSAVPKHLRGQPGACLGVLDDAIRFHVNPYALARQSYFVNDILSYSAAFFMAVINAHAPLKTRPDIRFEGEGQEMRAIVTGTFRDGAEREYRSPRIADIQPKNSPLWKSDPGQQLAYYSLRAFARRWCPEVIMGIHDVDEIREAQMTDVTPKAEALPRPAPRSLEEFAAAASGAHSPEEEPAAAGERLTAAAAPARADAIERILGLAGDRDLEPDERLAELDNLRPAWDELLDAAFLDVLFATAAKVTRGELKPLAAKKYLEGLKP